MTRPETQLLLRNEARVFGGPKPIVIVDPPDSADAERLDADGVELWVRHFALARADHRADRVHFGVRWSTPAAQAVVFLPKGRRLQAMTFAQLAAQLTPGAVVWVVGANRAGIKSVAKTMTQHFVDVASIDSARRCTLVRARTSDIPPSFDLAEWTTAWTARVGEWTVDVDTVPGTFSDGELDDGTAELLAAIESTDVGERVLDLCCGSGVIGTMVAKHRPRATVLLVDADAAAVASTVATIARNGLTNASVRPSDWYSDVDGTFDTILCNPPFHLGVETDTTMVDRVIDGAQAHLRAQGTLWMVANRSLPYLKRLQRAFARVDIVRQTSRYRVYRCGVGPQTGSPRPAR